MNPLEAITCSPATGCRCFTDLGYAGGARLGAAKLPAARYAVCRCGSRPPHRGHLGPAAGWTAERAQPVHQAQRHRGSGHWRRPGPGSGQPGLAEGEPGELPGLATVLGDDRVIGLDPDYGWVLARTPRLDEATMAGIRRILQRNGYHDVRVELSDTRL